LVTARNSERLLRLLGFPSGLSETVSLACVAFFVEGGAFVCDF
jgi:hypothetical protein